MGNQIQVGRRFVNGCEILQGVPASEAKPQPLVRRHAIPCHSANWSRSKLLCNLIGEILRS